MKYLVYATSINELIGKVFDEPSVIAIGDNVIFTNIEGEDRKFIIDSLGNKIILDNTPIVTANTLYYEDANNNILTDWNSFTSDNVVPSTIAPASADHIGVYNDSKKVGTVALDSEAFILKHNYGTCLYRVGLMADVHYDDTCAADDTVHKSDDSGNTWNPYEDLENVLDFFNKDSNISFVACAGDISTNLIEHVQAFHSRVEELSPNTPVFTCKGNHDNVAAYNNNDLWLQYTIPSDSPYPINYFTSGDKTSFYFIKEDDVYIFFNLDYGNSDSAASEKDASGNYIYYNDDTIEELQGILNTYRNQRCFVFTHLYFSQKTGNPQWDYSIMHDDNYILTGRQFKLLNELNNYYVNSVWFSGHTHYQWKWQSICSRVNVCNFDILDDYSDDYLRNKNNTYDNLWHTDKKESAWNVHLPSACRPLKPQNYLEIANYEDAIADPGSEGGIMDVYEDGVNIKGIIFADENSTVTTVDGVNTITYDNKYASFANYWLPVGGSNIREIETQNMNYFTDKI